MRSGGCFAAHLFVLFLRKVWADGAQGWFGMGQTDARMRPDGTEGGVVEHLTNRIFGKRRVVV